MSDSPVPSANKSRSLFDRHTLFIALFGAMSGIAAASSATLSDFSEQFWSGHQSATAFNLSLMVETVEDSTPVFVVRNPTDQISRAYGNLLVAAAEITRNAAARHPQATTFEVWFRNDVTASDTTEPFPGLRRHTALTGHRKVDGAIEFLDWERTVYSVPLSDTQPSARSVLAQFIPELLDRQQRTPADWEPFQNRVKPILLRGNPREVRSLLGAPDVAALSTAAEFLQRVPTVNHIRIKVPLTSSVEERENLMFECLRTDTGFSLQRKPGVIAAMK